MPVPMLLAVNYIHSLGIVHRDIKPRNWVYEADGQTIKLIDFGFSVKGYLGAESLQGCMGTLGYLAPEVVKAGLSSESAYTAKCDIWSLGVVFDELLTGEPAFHRDAGQCDGYTEEVVLREIKEVSEEIIEKVLAQVPANAVPLLRRMLTKDPLARPSAREVLDDNYLALVRARIADPPRALPVRVILDRFRAHASASKPSRAWLLAVARSPTYLPWEEFCALRETFKMFDAQGLNGTVNFETFFTVLQRAARDSPRVWNENPENTFDNSQGPIRADIAKLWKAVCGEQESLSYCEFMAVLLPPMEDVFADADSKSAENEVYSPLRPKEHWSPSKPIFQYLQLLKRASKSVPKTLEFDESEEVRQVVSVMARHHRRWALVRYKDGRRQFFDYMDINHKLLQDAPFGSVAESMSRICKANVGTIANCSQFCEYVPANVATPLRDVILLIAGKRNGRPVRRVPLVDADGEIVTVFSSLDFLNLALKCSAPTAVLKSLSAKVFDRRGTILQVSVQQDEPLLNALGIMEKEGLTICPITLRELSGTMGGVVASNVVSAADLKWVVRSGNFAALNMSVGDFVAWRAESEQASLDHILRQQRLQRFNVVSVMAAASLHTLAQLTSVCSKDDIARIVGIVSSRDILLQPDPAKVNEATPCERFRRELQEVAPCASRLYEAVARPGQLGRQVEDQLLHAAPYLTGKQVEHLLRRANVSVALRQRLKFLLGLKRRVQKVAQGYGGPAFMPQGMAVGFFLATAIRASYADRGTLTTRVVSAVPAATRHLAAVLHEQRAIANELCRLQERQRLLAEEALRLAGEEAETPMGPSRPRPAPEATSMLACLDTGAPAAAAVSANAARTHRSQAPEPLASTPSVVRKHGSSSSVFDLGSSLLGPTEVAVLLQSGLAAVPQGRQVQQNQRMLLEMMVSQPPLFLKGVLYELSNCGSSRVLGNHLMALLDLTQDAIRPAARLDVADLLTQALGVGMPRRSDFMAGGSSASRSYLLLVHRAAKQVLEECEPYVALKHWLQRAEVPLPARDMPMPSAERAIQAAQRAVQEADAAGSAWLTERGEVWYDGVLSDPPASPPSGPKEPELRSAARQLYLDAFAACKDALQASPEVLHQDWFHGFWARNYDALTVVSVLRNMQMDIDETRKWLDAQLSHTHSDFKGAKKACDLLWSKTPASEACLVDCLIEVLFFEPADRSKYRSDGLIQLVIEEPPGHFNFTVVSAMGVITEGEKGTEMAATYARLRQLRGVEVVRADTATLQSVDYNAAMVERAVQERVQTPWGWVGYSQGCANAFRAEAIMLQGTPEQQHLMASFRCRQLLFSAANGSAHATCGDWKLLRALVDGERFLKRFQASMSAATQNLALDLLQNALSSRLAYAVLGSVQSLTHEGARIMWRKPGMLRMLEPIGVPVLGASGKLDSEKTTHGEFMCPSRMRL
ncbi:unnamed protein product [Effrenium voratum]|nr:unnamed protein product [Effrenium voratum]